MQVVEIHNVCKRYTKANICAISKLSLAIKQGELLCVVGESGSGKTTLLRLIAGFEKPERGTIMVKGNIVANQYTFISPDRRNIGMVFQDYALFPHLTVAQNVGFGLHRLMKQQRQEKIKEVLALVGLTGFEKRYPDQLSGGQQQRVALARALAPSPAIILLDEPFSHLDSKLKDQVREEIGAIIKKSKTTAIIVTHDTVDALSIADSIAVLRAGELQQWDTPREIYRNPVDAYVAQFFGKVNLIRAVAVQNGFESELGFIHSNEAAAVQGKVTLNIRPEDIQLCKEGKAKCRGCVQSIQYCGSCQRIKVATPTYVIETITHHANDIKIGDTVFVKVEEKGMQVL